MAHNEEIMGLCGETNIANKAETWVTMIQGELNRSSVSASVHNYQPNSV